MLLQIHCWVLQQKNIQNQSEFSELMTRFHGSACLTHCSGQQLFL